MSELNPPTPKETSLDHTEDELGLDSADDDKSEEYRPSLYP